jgi:hypothetical protein
MYFQQKQSPLHRAVVAGFDELAVLVASYGGNVLLEDSVSFSLLFMPPF